MSMVAISMRKLKAILQLKYEAKLSHRQIARSLSISPSTVSTYANRARQLGLCSWPLSVDWDDKRLSNAFGQTTVTLRSILALPNWRAIHQELKRKGVTQQLLWQEYAERYPDNHYSYTHFCREYRLWRQRQPRSMRQTHQAGEKLFVDYCGQTVPLVDTRTGEIRQAQVFVAVLGASNYTYVEATESQALEHWVMSHKRAFEFFEGVTALVVPDNLRSGVSRACRYEPDINPTYHQLACHYGVAILPARPRKPKDKAKAETGVQVVSRWILARLRHETFYSLAQLNQRIHALLVDLNTRPFKKLPGSRQSQFLELDKPALRPLPRAPYEYTFIKKVRVYPDYHVEIDRHYYSVPYALIKKQLDAHITGHIVRLYHRNTCVAQHPRCHRPGHTTLPEHMPKRHRAHMSWTPGRLKNWAKDIGPATLQWVDKQLQQRNHPEQAYRACLGLLNLSRAYPKQRLDAACRRALKTGACRLKNIQAILKNNLDQQPLPQSQPDLLDDIKHDNLRGSDYYH